MCALCSKFRDVADARPLLSVTIWAGVNMAANLLSLVVTLWAPN